MALAVEYKGFYTIPTLPSEIPDEWEQTLKAEIQRIYNNLVARIANADDFKKYIANPAYESWQNFVNPDWEDVDFIKLKYKVKLGRAYNAWKAGIDSAFGQGDPEQAYFDERVTDKKSKFAGGIPYVLASVGYRAKLGRGIAVKAIGVISGMRKVKSDITGAETFTGDVVNVFLPGAARFVRPQAIAIITEGLVLAQYAHEAGDAPTRDAVISAVNSVLSNTVLKQVDTSAYTVTLEIGYDDVEGKLFAHSKAETVTA